MAVGYRALDGIDEVRRRGEEFHPWRPNPVGPGAPAAGPEDVELSLCVGNQTLGPLVEPPAGVQQGAVHGIEEPVIGHPEDLA